MDAKDLRSETTIGERSNNGHSKFAQGGATAPCSATKPYENISTNPLAKLETPTSRPCAVIGPDRIVPPSNGDVYSKKSHYEPWLHVDNTFRQPPEYPHKISNFQSPIRNISPRQTFQENMQRIMVQPTYNSVKLNDDPNYILDRNNAKNSKISGVHEAKYCDTVPYSVNPISSDQKPNEMCVTNMNSSRNFPQMWHPGSVGIRPSRPYGAPDLYQFPEYTSCTAPRPMPMQRPHRTINEDPSQQYSETYYPEGNIRFKPYPTIKERYPHTRYEYLNNYANTFHPPPPFPAHKYDLQKPLPPHVTYPQVPIKYLDNRMNETVMDGYQRPQTVNYNIPYRNQVIHPAYAPMIGSNIPNKVYPYPSDGSVKSVAPNKLPYDSKFYTEYENARNKGYPMPDSVYLNEMVRPHMKNQPTLPNYPTANMHTHPYYRKENMAAKNYEYMSHLRHLDPSLNPNALPRLSTQFSPNAIAISPSDSNTSIETSHTHGGSLEDCGYVSQSSTASIRSYDSVNRMMPNDFHQRYNYPYQTMVRSSPLLSKPDVTGNSSKEKKNIDVRQFLQMWNEGEEENGGKEKEVLIQSDFNSSKLANQFETMKTNEQLYVLGLVNVPSEELSKYEHIQKISKLPENIKGYNNIELLKHFEEAIESSNISNSNHKPPTPSNYHSSIKSSLIQGTGLFPSRPISPLDVEAKISQSVIHKEVGCNFEIKPCSPEMLNAEVATTAQRILDDERVIEKVSNPIMVKSPIVYSTNEREKNGEVIIDKEHRIMLKEDTNKTASCKMINTQCANNEDHNAAKANYSIQDLESNAGVCLASLPRLDNDIELNFPEVNQQFINANKESVIIANDFTSEIDALPDNNNYKINEHISQKSENPSLAVATLDIATEVTKLSKYRKIKRNEVENNDKQFLAVSQPLRTDSVIIKNPENVKSFEKNPEMPTLEKKTSENQSVDHDLLNSTDSDNSDKNEGVMNNPEDSNDMAIDFSLNRLENKHNTITENSEKFYKKSNLSLQSENILVVPLLPEDTNTSSKSTKDITADSSVPDDDIITCSLSKNINKFYSSIELKNTNIDVQKQKSMEYSENISENLAVGTVDNESERRNIANVSPANEINIKNNENLTETTEGEIRNKSIKSIGELVTSVDNTNYQDKDTSIIMDTLPTIDKISKQDTIPNIKNKEITHASDVFYSNFGKENSVSPFVNCNLTIGELNSTKNNNKNLKKEVNYTQDDKNETYFTSSPILPKLVDMRNVFVKIVRLNKELFSPQIQNLLLGCEGKTCLPSLKNVSDVSILAGSIVSDSGKEIQSKLSDVQNTMVIRDTEMEVLAIENLTSQNELPSESTNDIQYSINDLVPETTVVDKIPSINDGINDKSHSESTIDDCHIPDPDTKISIAHNLNSVTDLTKQSNIISENTYVNGCADSNSDAKVLCMEDFSNVKLHSKDRSETRNINDYSMLEPEGLDNKNTRSGTECINSEIQSTDMAEACPTLDVDEVRSGVDSLNSKLQSQSTDNKTSLDFDMNIESSGFNQLNTVKHCIDRSEIISKDCAIIDSNINIYDGASPKRITDCTNTQPKTLLTSASNVENSTSDNMNYSITGNQLESKTDSDCHSFDYNKIKAGVDDQNCKSLSVSTDVESCVVLVSNVNRYSADRWDSDQEFVDTELQPKSTYVKDLLLSESLVKTSNVNISVSSINSKLQSKITDNTECPISDSDADTFPVFNLNTAKDKENSILQPSACIGNNELLEPSSYAKAFSVNSEHNVSDLKMSTLGNFDATKICNNREVDLKSNAVKNDLTHNLDPELETSVENLNSLKTCTYNLNLKLCNRKESSQIIESDNIQAELCLSSNVLLTSNSTRTNQNYYPDITDTEMGADLFEVEPIVEDSEVHIIVNESGNLQDQISDKKLGEEDTKGSFIKRCLKRSLSDSALNFYSFRSGDGFQEDIELQDFIAAKKRRKYNDFLKVGDPHFSPTDMLNIHNNRRNSISSVYNGENNMSFCIVIDDNCIISEENEDGDKLCFTQIPEACLTDNFEETPEIVICPQENNNECEEPFVLQISNEKSLEESWVDDVACVETVVSDDIAEDFELSGPTSPAEIGGPLNDESDIFTSVSEHTEKVKYIYGDKMCDDDAELVDTLFRTPQMDMNKTLIRESHIIEDGDDFLGENINQVLPAPHSQNTETVDKLVVANETADKPSLTESGDDNLNEKNNKASTSSFIVSQDTSNDGIEDVLRKPLQALPGHDILDAKINKIETDTLPNVSCVTSQDNTINSCESIVDNIFSYNREENMTDYPVFSSSEVSSTTPEEKNTSLLLKITNHQGTRTSQLKDIILTTKNSCKFTENINYTNFISNSTEPRPLITKAAQKYIPPLKETVDDLKVKLHLPSDSLMKYKQLKIDKTGVRHSAVPKKDIPKKPKPKFEDVLKSIDEIQFKMHREKSKKPKKFIPKVLIKKSENGSHYASTPNSDCYNPDLTGRKWQPWVFIEKNSFIDKMALRRKTKAIYNHRNNTYVFADKFKKYRSIQSAKFVITQPKLDKNSSVGQLKYTIRLKHSY